MRQIDLIKRILANKPQEVIAENNSEINESNEVPPVEDKNNVTLEQEKHHQVESNSTAKETPKKKNTFPSKKKKAPESGA